MAKSHACGGGRRIECNANPMASEMAYAICATGMVNVMRCHVFSSLFFKEGPPQQERQDERAGRQKVRKAAQRVSESVCSQHGTKSERCFVRQWFMPYVVSAPQSQ